MKSNSYFEDLDTVDRLLSDVTDNISSKYALIHEAKKNLCECRRKFKEVITRDINDKEFQAAYQNLSRSYIVLEGKVAPFIKRYGYSFNSRVRVLTCFDSVVDSKTGVVKYMLLLNNDIISPDNLSVLNRLVKECKTIGFFLTQEERSTLEVFEEYLESI